MRLRTAQTHTGYFCTVVIILYINISVYLLLYIMRNILTHILRLFVLWCNYYNPSNMCSYPHSGYEPRLVRMLISSPYVTVH